MRFYLVCEARDTLEIKGPDMHSATDKPTEWDRGPKVMGLTSSTHSPYSECCNEQVLDTLIALFSEVFSYSCHIRSSELPQYGCFTTHHFGLLNNHDLFQTPA